MSIKLTKEELSTVVNGRRILRKKGLNPNTDVKTLCQEAGISRKTGYQWADEHIVSDLLKKNKSFESELNRQKEKSATAEKESADLRFKIECHQVAMEIHGIDKHLLKKKGIIKRKSGRR